MESQSPPNKKIILSSIEQTLGQLLLISKLGRKDHFCVFKLNFSTFLFLNPEIEIPMQYYNVFINYYPYSLCHKKNDSIFIVDKYYNF